MSVRGWGETREVHESMRGIDKIDSQNIFPRWKCERLISLALRSEGISLKEMCMAICFLKEISRCLEYSARGRGETDTIVALKKFYIGWVYISEMEGRRDCLIWQHVQHRHEGAVYVWCSQFASGGSQRVLSLPVLLSGRKGRCRRSILLSISLQKLARDYNNIYWIRKL